MLSSRIQVFILFLFVGMMFSSPTHAFQTGQRIMAVNGGANARNTALTSVLFLQSGGVYGTLVGSPVNATAGGYTGNWWQINWDSTPPSQIGIQTWSAESVISLAPSAGDVAEPNLSSHYYTTDNPFFPSYAPNSIGGSLGTLGNCTWYVNGRLRELGYNTTQINTMLGYAMNWASEASSAGIKVDNTPTVGSIAQLDSGSFSSLGHVAVVESVNADGTITVTESVYSTDLTSVWDFLWHHRTVFQGTSTWPSNFIHVGRTDTTPPTIAITSPVGSGQTYATGTGTVNVSGTASDNVGVVNVIWANNRGGGGSASGTTSWSAPGIALQSGSNAITVTAYDAAGNNGAATIYVNYTPGDTTPPTIAITSPVGSGQTYATGTGTVNVSGTASDNVGVVNVIWANNRGGGGSASGTTSWSAPGIALQSGSNTITVTAYDAAGNNGAATIYVNYTPGVPAVLTTPVPGSTLPGASVTFGWSSGSGVTQYSLYVGTTAGGNDLYDQSQGTNLSATVTNLPTTGQRIYVTLWSNIAGSWQTNNYTYVASLKQTDITPILMLLLD